MTTDRIEPEVTAVGKATGAGGPIWSVLRDG